MPGIVLHVGLPKTGTTLLQKGVFPRLGGVHYAGKLGAGHEFTVPGLGAAIDQVYLSDSILSDPAPALSQALAPLRAAARDRTVVISTEALVHPAAQDLGLVAERLARAVPEARILLTLRAQPDLALSWFRSHGRFAQYLFLRKAESEQLPAHLTQRAWWDWVCRDPGAGLLAMLDFDAIAGKYGGLFGGRVQILPLELLTRAPDRYAALLSRILETPETIALPGTSHPRENQGLSRREILASRILLRFGQRSDFLGQRHRSRWRRWLAEGPLADPILDPEIQEQLQARYQTGNRALAERAGLDLSCLGYP